jgi:LytS/YehU family sensor histidine kinase
MISTIRTRIASFPKRLSWFLLVLGGLIIIVFNDAFGSSEIFGMLAFAYFALLIFLFCRWLFKQIKAIINLKNEQKKTELMHLKSQVNPHFFFNMLNNIYGLVEKDSKKAQALILKLSDLMRYGLYEGQNEEVLLSKEVAYLENYIELHKMRYHKSIDVRFDADIKEDYEVMPLLFIILLENAFKHGVENLREGAYVQVNMIAEKKSIYFEIENNFDASQEPEQPGIGLQNLKRRLELVYPKMHEITFSKSNGIFNSKFTIKGL